MKTYRLSPEDLPWSASAQPGVATRDLFASDMARLSEVMAQPGTTWRAPTRALMLVTEGTLGPADETRCGEGDLYWCNQDLGQDTGVFESGEDGARWHCIEPLQNIGSELRSTSIVSADKPWESFDDPAGRPTQPVQVLLDGTLSALRTRFDPEYIAGEHWHDFDTLYFIGDGTMQFGDEGWFETGQVRAVHGGHSYGPERPGQNGVEFVLISLGGPVALHWSDLEPPPPQ